MKNTVNISYICFVILLLFSCKTEQETITQPVPDNYIYGINNEQLYSSSIEKNKQKTDEQYISILYANLFQTDIPQNDLSEMAEIRQAIGDKQMIDELLLNSFSNNNNIVIPSDAEMRQDMDTFIEKTYLRFFLRKPTAYEIFEMKKIIDEDDELTPSLIYQGFALSAEYKFY